MIKGGKKDWTRFNGVSYRTLAVIRTRAREGRGEISRMGERLVGRESAMQNSIFD